MRKIIKNDLVKIGLYFLCTVVGGAIIAPWLFFAGKEIAASGMLHESSSEGLRELGRILEETNFQRYFNRAILLSALICLVPLIRSLNLFNRNVLGLAKNPSKGRHFLGGFSLAGGLLLFMGWMFVLSGIFEPRTPEQRDVLWVLMRGAIISALAVAFLEEFLFRGMMLGVCVRAAGKHVALIFVTAIFAAVHFLKPPDSLLILDADVNWATGFSVVLAGFGQLTNPVPLVAEFATLFLVGWVLGVARLRTNSLWVSIGMHAGWVFGLKTFSGLTLRAAPLEETLPWVGKDLNNGVISSLVVAITGWLAHFWLRGAQEANAA